MTSALFHSLGKNITHITLHCALQAPLGRLLHHGTPWQGQSDRHASYDKLPTSSAISADQKLLHRKGQEKPEALWEALKRPPQVSSHRSPRPIPPNSPPPEFSLLLEGQKQPWVQDVLFWLPAVVSGKAKSSAGEPHPVGFRGQLPHSCGSKGTVQRGSPLRSHKSLKLVSITASNPQVNCHLKPQAPAGHEGTQQSTLGRKTNPNKEQSSRGNPPGLARAREGRKSR